MCSPSMSSSWRREKGRVIGAAKRRPGRALEPLSAFLPRSRTCCGVAASSGSAWKSTEGRQSEAAAGGRERTLAWIPVVVFNELDQLLLSVRFSRDENRIIHEGLVKVHLVELQLQSFGNLWVTSTSQPGKLGLVTDTACFSFRTFWLQFVEYYGCNNVCRAGRFS